jgi:hypothetical protein
MLGALGSLGHSAASCLIQLSIAASDLWHGDDAVRIVQGRSDRGGVVSWSGPAAVPAQTRRRGLWEGSFLRHERDVPPAWPLPVGSARFEWSESHQYFRRIKTIGAR